MGNNNHRGSKGSFRLDTQCESFRLVLTPREKQIVDLIVQGYLNKQIAYYFHVKEQTIKNSLNCIFKKLGIHTRTELAIKAIRLNGLL